jgi:hypothetical protein
LGRTIPRLASSTYIRGQRRDTKGKAEARRQAAWWLIHTAATQVLLDVVQAYNPSDALALVNIAAMALNPPEPAQQRKVARRLARYFKALLAGSYRLGGPKTWTTTIQTDQMVPPTHPAIG